MRRFPRLFSRKANGHAHRQLATTRLGLLPLEERAVPAFGFGWAFNAGNADFDVGNGLAVDGLGNAYVSGSYSGTVDFDPGPATVNLTASGAYGDGFVAKYAPDGSLQWATDLGLNSGAGARVAVQGTSVYVVDYVGTAGDTNVAQLDAASGAINWAVTLAGGSGGETTGVAASPTGGVYVTGNNTAAQVFVTRLDAAGSVLWTRTNGGGGTANSIAVDAAGNAHVIGDFTGTATFGSTSLTSWTSTTSDAFIWKVDAAGNPVWAGKMGSNGTELGRDIAVDAGGNVLVTGSWGYGGTSVSQNNDFDPGTGTLKLSNAGSYDIFVAKLTPNANGSLSLSWARSIGGANWDTGIRLTTDGAGNVYTTGTFTGPVDFDPGTTTYTLQGHGSSNPGMATDVYVSKLSASGAFAAAAGMGGTQRRQQLSVRRVRNPRAVNEKEPS